MPKAEEYNGKVPADFLQCLKEWEMVRGGNLPDLSSIDEDERKEAEWLDESVEALGWYLEIEEQSKSGELIEIIDRMDEQGSWWLPSELWDAQTKQDHWALDGILASQYNYYKILLEIKRKIKYVLENETLSNVTQ